MKLKNIEWHITLGSLVKVTSTDLSGNLVNRLGIVVTGKNLCQQNLFPFVKVYTFRDQEINEYYPYSIEVLSQHEIS